MSSASQPIGVIAKLLDLSERRVQQLSREGVIPKATRGQYDLIGSVRGYVQYLRDQALKAQAGAPDYASERARFIRARADLAEMEAEEKRGSVIAAEYVEGAWIAVLTLLRTRILALPDRLAPQLHSEASPAGVRDALRSALREVLEELAESDVRPEDDNDSDAETAGIGGVAPDCAYGPEGADAAAGTDDQ
ncbi:terminase small subunit, Nu1 [Antarctobacter jejuensis]|uniref:terminase small subunit, Nu1 n=1 Tax=Antarctobacter jejuensis TaxID=1439938 RepID=UPI003FD43ADB